MEILKSRCVGCGNCTIWCPVGCIYVGEDGLAEVNQEECLECGNCFRMCPDGGLNPFLVRFVRRVLRSLRLAPVHQIDICPTGALHPPELSWPRIVRRYFSDPTVPHDYSTQVRGRGTEEIKTNDVTGRLREGEVGFVVEVGRPGTGALFRDIQKISMALAELGVKFEQKNPVTFLMIDLKQGKIREDVLNEKVLSAIIEFKTTMDKVEDVLGKLTEVESRLDTVFSVGIAAKCNPDGSAPYEDLIQSLGWSLSIQSKSNLGLGRPLAAN